jgi:hypothetical protein
MLITLPSFLRDVTAAVPHFVAVEIGDVVEMVFRLRLFAARGCGAFIAVVWMEMVVDVAAEISRA